MSDIARRHSTSWGKAALHLGLHAVNEVLDDRKGLPRPRRGGVDFLR